MICKMDATSVLDNMTAIKSAFSIIAALNLTAHHWPPSPQVHDGACYDVIVCGAGSAGATLAARLAERSNLRVLLLEAGNDPPIPTLYPGLIAYLPRTPIDWNYTADSGAALFRNHRIPLTRGKMLGGSSGINYMVYVRGGPVDYSAWSHAARSHVWDWESVLPYFKRSEHLQDHDVLSSPSGAYHGTQGPIGVTRQHREENYKYLEAFREVGNNIVNDINGNIKLGYTEPLFTIANGVRQSSAYAFLRRPRKNLDIVRKATVTRVLFDEKRTAVGVRVLVDDCELTIHAAKQVVLSAGAFNTPKLLQLSGIGPASTLKSLGIPVLVDLPVGYNLLDHTSTFFVFATDKLPKTPPPTDPTKFPVPITLGFSTPYGNGSDPFYESENLVTNSEGIIQFVSGTFGVKEDIAQRIAEAGKGRELLLSILLELRGKSRGRVTICSTDPLVPPHIDYDQYSDPRDVEAMVDYIEHYLQVTNSSYFRHVGAELLDAAPPECVSYVRWSRKYWRCYIHYILLTQYHYGGTCSLGSVVDDQLRVFGVKNLRVADASIMPVLPGGNINAPCIMIGERAADFILNDVSLFSNFSACPNKNSK